MEVLGRPCLIREVGEGQLVMTTIAPVVDEVIAPSTILDVLQGWKQGWFWKRLEILGDVD